MARDNGEITQDFTVSGTVLEVATAVGKLIGESQSDAVLGIAAGAVIDATESCARGSKCAEFAEVQSRPKGARPVQRLAGAIGCIGACPNPELIDATICDFRARLSVIEQFGRISVVKPVD